MGTVLASGAVRDLDEKIQATKKRSKSKRLDAQLDLTGELAMVGVLTRPSRQWDICALSFSFALAHEEKETLLLLNKMHNHLDISPPSASSPRYVGSTSPADHSLFSQCQGSVSS